jgi:quercetin dioxygenase-like cupin family protein
LWIGPADFSATAGYPGQWEGPGVAETILAIKETIRRHGKQCGIVATGPDDLAMRRDQKFRVLGLGFDMGMMFRGLAEMLAKVGRPLAIAPDFIPVPHDDAPPERFESIARVESATPARLIPAPGVVLRPLVGAHNQAHNLFTGLATIDPEAEWPYHSRPCGEALTLLSGEVVVDVEGHRYLLRPLDHVYIPRALAHRVINPSRREPAVLHVALADDVATERPHASSFEEVIEPDDARGREGAERVVRQASAETFELAPGARFRDDFNASLSARGICGGYGRFDPGARLPCHRHDFDESITIIEGTAVCMVEGRRYELSGNATALVPRGRCHYFINQSDAPMAMLWVYAGDMPDRIVLDESRCQAPSGRSHA